jgi:hypothetical protein
MAKTFNRTRPDSGQRNRVKKPRDKAPEVVKEAISKMQGAGDSAAAEAHTTPTINIKAADLVRADNDKFPARSASSPPPPGAAPEGQPGVGGGTAPPAQPPPARPGGRPVGSKDSYQRGRPARKDWPNEPITPAKPAAEGKNGAAEPIKEARAELVPPDYRPLACLLVDMGMGACVEFLGPRWKPSPPPMPELPDERENMIIQLTKYLEANHIQDIPPGYMLAIAITGYAIPRVVMQVREYIKSRRGVVVIPPRRPNPNGPERPKEAEKKVDLAKPAAEPEQPAAAAGPQNTDLGPGEDDQLMTP